MLSAKPKFAVPGNDRYKDRRDRRHPRFRADFRVTVTFLAASQYQRTEGHSRDLSQGGIGLLLADELKIGEVVGLVFALPREEMETWEVRAVVRHRHGYHYGFEFLALGNERLAILKAYLSGLEQSD
jgi:c-di-GMP-binding flagellar brake protein YcgR